MRSLRQLHTRITARCDDDLGRIAAIEGMTKSAVVRHALFKFTRGYVAEQADLAPMNGGGLEPRMKAQQPLGGGRTMEGVIQNRGAPYVLR